MVALPCFLVIPFSMNLTNLRYFVAVAELGSITKAAQALHLTQPAVTRGIRQLEIELEIKLFERLPRAMRLTRFGKGYLRHAQAVFVQLENARNEMRHLADHPVEDVVIGAGPTWLMGRLPAIIGELTRKYPNAPVRVRGGYDLELLAMLNRGEVAFILTETFGVSLPADLVQEPLIHCDYVVACRLDHPLAARKKVSLEALLDFPWTMPDQGVNALERLKGIYLGENLRAPIPHIHSTSLGFILKLLSASDALAFVVRSSLGEIASDRITTVDVDRPMPIRHAGIVKRQAAWESPIEKDLIEMLRADCKMNPVQ